MNTIPARADATAPPLGPPADDPVPYADTAALLVCLRDQVGAPALHAAERLAELFDLRDRLVGEVGAGLHTPDTLQGIAAFDKVVRTHAVVLDLLADHAATRRPTLGCRSIWSLVPELPPDEPQVDPFLLHAVPPVVLPPR